MWIVAELGLVGARVARKEQPQVVARVSVQPAANFCQADRVTVRLEHNMQAAVRPIFNVVVIVHPADQNASLYGSGQVVHGLVALNGHGLECN